MGNTSIKEKSNKKGAVFFFLKGGSALDAEVILFDVFSLFRIVVLGGLGGTSPPILFLSIAKQYHL